MATKSRNDFGVMLSIVSIAIALFSIGYCFPHILDMISRGWERSTQVISYFTRIIRGGTA